MGLTLKLTPEAARGVLSAIRARKKPAAPLARLAESLQELLEGEAPRVEVLSSEVCGSGAPGALAWRADRLACGHVWRSKPNRCGAPGEAKVRPCRACLGEGDHG